jgi:hypothetical protein
MNHLWTAARVAFSIMCLGATVWLFLWVIGCVISAHVSAKQRQRKANDHRVGGVISP